MAISAIRSNNYLKMSFAAARPARAFAPTAAAAAPAAGMGRGAVVSVLRSSARATPAPLMVAGPSIAAPVASRRGLHSGASARNWFALVQEASQDARMPSSSSFSAQARGAYNWHRAAQEFTTAAAAEAGAVKRSAMDTGASNWFRAAQEATRGAAPVAFDRGAWNWFRAAARA